MPDRLTPDMRRALLAIENKGALTRGKKGWYAGFSTGGYSSIFANGTVAALRRLDLLEVASPGGYLRLTNKAVAITPRLRAVPEPGHTPKPVMRPPGLQKPRPPSFKVRLPYVD